MKTILLCDDDEGVRGALSFLLSQNGFDVKAFGDGMALLAHMDASPMPMRGVLLLDVRMEPMSGPEVHDALIARGRDVHNPVLFLSGHGDVPMAVQAMTKGALNFIEKPYTDDTMVQLLEAACVTEEAWQGRARRAIFLQSLWNSLTPQQRKVGLLVAEGNLNKLIAAELDVSERMVEVHRAKVFEKLGVDSAAALATTVADMRGLRIVPASH